MKKWFKNHPKPKTGQPPRKKVVLFDDTYLKYHQTEVGISAVELLESCGYVVILAQAGCCQRPRISHGFLRKAKVAGQKTLRNLDAYIQQDLKIVVCEPGCCSALTDDLPDLIDDEQLGQRFVHKHGGVQGEGWADPARRAKGSAAICAALEHEKAAVVSLREALSALG